jgi:orotidine-5'-phosphate decarboxylase
LWIALDVPDAVTAEQWMRTFPEHRHYKVGMELFYQIGPQLLRQWIEEKELAIFLDLKLHDIPRTVAHSITGLERLGVRLTTIHLSGGTKMCEAAQAASRTMDIVGVSVLTSLDDGDLTAVGINGSVVDQLQRLAAIGRQAGLSGVVVSGRELPVITAVWPQARLVVPGIRRREDSPHDQKRVVTANQALSWGATDLVVGRTLLHAENPREIYEEFAALLQGEMLL